MTREIVDGMQSDKKACLFVITAEAAIDLGCGGLSKCFHGDGRSD